MSNERFIYPSCPNGGAVPCYCLACAPETTRLHRAEAADCLRPSDANLASCDCPVCVCRVSVRAEAAARAPETATQYLAREQAEIRAAFAAYVAECEGLRTFLKDCRCPCCDARARLRALRETSYERACASPAAVHCASTDRRDDNEDARLAADAAAAAAEKEYRDAEETVHPTGPYHETDTDAR